MVFNLKFNKDRDGHWKLLRKDWWKHLSPEAKATLVAQEREAGWDGYWDKDEWIVVGPCEIKLKRADGGRKHDRIYYSVQFKKPIPRTDPPVKSINYNWFQHGEYRALQLAKRHLKCPP